MLENSRGPGPVLGRLLALLCAFAACCLLTTGHAGAAEPRWQAPLPRPLEVVRPFEAPPGPYAAGHRGADLRAPLGSAVRAPGQGTVRFAGPVAGRGVVSVDSGGLRFSYEPVQVRVRAGQTVVAGSVLGLLAAGHPGCGDCLHWGVRRGTQYLDPLHGSMTRVRLLPLDGVPDTASRRSRAPTSPSPESGALIPAAAGLAAAAAARRGR
jgi:murein DD-endopeptidase MepM/ murein hydrolase activator NlpD